MPRLPHYRARPGRNRSIPAALCPILIRLVRPRVGGGSSCPPLNVPPRSKVRRSRFAVLCLCIEESL